MSQTSEFYEARAREAEEHASRATLENVRERNLVAAKTWQGLADQARRVMQNRAARAAGEATDLGTGPSTGPSIGPSTAI